MIFFPVNILLLIETFFVLGIFSSSGHGASLDRKKLNIFSLSIFRENVENDISRNEKFP